ncbi:hypothetical protein ADEAN_000100600 [Angomonas deanei]|uniref:Uncharacterized protein n=1 Tax=Angomonas deanei TaxID=59799 RepID=A0A7G2C4A6_9TRYP|nr:hypothetical protein ADEAN_000100600 [Angomonas deanei]
MTQDPQKSPVNLLPSDVHSLKDLSVCCRRQRRAILVGGNQLIQKKEGTSGSTTVNDITKLLALLETCMQKDKASLKQVKKATTQALNETLDRMETIKVILLHALLFLFDNNKQYNKWGGLATADYTFDNKSFSFSDDDTPAARPWKSDEMLQLAPKFQMMSVELLVHVFEHYGTKAGEEKLKMNDSEGNVASVIREVHSAHKTNTAQSLFDGKRQAANGRVFYFYLLAEEIRGLSLWLMDAVLLFFDFKSMNLNTLLSSLFPFTSTEEMDAVLFKKGHQHV